MKKFDLKHCSLTIRETSAGLEIFVENGHEEGPIWLAIGQSEIEALKTLISCHGFETEATKLLSFLAEPKKFQQIRDVFKSSTTTLRRLVQTGAVEVYQDSNNEFGRYQRPMVNWYVATGQTYSFKKSSRPQKTFDTKDQP